MHARGVVRNRAAIPTAEWGLHLTDANVALGDLVGMARHEIKSYLARH